MNAEIVLNIVLVYTVLAAIGAVVIFFVLLQSEDKIFTNAVNNIKKASENWKALSKAKRMWLRMLMLGFFAVATVTAVFIWQYKKPIVVEKSFQTYNLKAVNGEELKAYEKLTCDVFVDVELERQWSGAYEANGVITIGDTSYVKTSGFVHSYLDDEDGYYVYFTLFPANDMSGFAHVDMQIEMTENGYELVYALVESGDAYDSEYVGPAESLEEAKAIYK